MDVVTEDVKTAGERGSRGIGWTEADDWLRRFPKKKIHTESTIVNFELMPPSYFPFPNTSDLCKSGLFKLLP